MAANCLYLRKQKWTTCPTIHASKSLSCLFCEGWVSNCIWAVHTAAIVHSNPECRDTDATDPHETSRLTRHVHCNDGCNGDVVVRRHKHRPCCQYQKVVTLPCATNMSIACAQPCDFDVYGRLNKAAHKASELLLWICHNA